MRPHIGYYPARSATSDVTNGTLEAPETCIGDEAIAEAIKISVDDWRMLLVRLKGRKNRPPIRYLGGLAVAEKTELIRWWRERITLPRVRR